MNRDGLSYSITILIVAIITISSALLYTNYHTTKEMNAPTKQKTLTFYQSVDCDHLIKHSVLAQKSISDAETILAEIDTPLKYQSIEIKNKVAYIDWPEDIYQHSWISTSCGSYTFLEPIQHSLTELDHIDSIIHSIDGNESDFYTFMQLSCPDQATHCNI
ncbi:hypothetical protein KKG22_03420 [Patescibacteria group bacterium]|nr:hypothetical protein [Patescibacteria group bacterium]MBU1721199.1 hypothetical protein [Patescibacteria group bacterium]MBU1901093.1 hypothetical protein [Patescibacteria group bacterium]